MRMFKKVRALQRKASLHLWLDRLVFRGDAKNIDDRLLNDIGLEPLDQAPPPDRFFFI